MNHIVIIGFMGSGKTRVGKRLAKDFDIPFVDIDRVVTKKMNLSSKEIFDRFGEPFYRALETTAVKALIEDPEQKVISLGSGLPMQEQNEKYIKKLGTVVYLKGSYETLKNVWKIPAATHCSRVLIRRTRSRNFSNSEIRCMRNLQMLK